MAEPGAPQGAASARVLLVDDDVEFLGLTAAWLRSRDLTCAVAMDGATALAALGAGRYDCVIADVCMPGMDGLELLRRIRQGWPDLTVLLLTGHASIQLGVAAVKLGAFEYLLKPIVLDDLLDAVWRGVKRP